MAETVIGKAIELVFEYTVVPVARQLKYVFCYKSCVEEMNDARIKMQNKKERVDHEKSAGKNNGQLIYKDVDDWLEKVTKIQEEVSSLLTNEEGKAKMNGCIIGGQILNPIARHQLGRKATKKKQAIEDLCQLRPKHEEIAYPPPPTGIVSAEDYSLVRAKQQTEGIFHTSGWEDIMEKIMTDLKDDKINVIGLHGMGGVGKTTMIKKVRLQVYEQQLFNEVAETKVTKSPNISRIQEEIGCELGLKLEDKSTIPRANRLRERLLKNDMKKEKKKVLIILDDLWEKLDLQDVGIPSGNEKVQIKLLLTSRYENVVSNEMEAHSIHLNILDDKESWEMFTSAVGEAKVTSIKKETTREIARRCGGLPLVIVAIANALKNKDTRAWEETLESLDKNNVLKNLEESYKHLPSDESRDLFLLCGIIRGPRIQAKDLLKYTLGLQRWNRRDRSTLIVAATKLKKLLSGLEDASMLVKSNDNRYVNIHDHMRDLAQKIVDENCKEWSHDLNLRDTEIFDWPDPSELKLLFSYGEGDSLQVPDSFFKVMKKLYVLEFTNSRVALSLPLSKSQLDHMGNLATLCLHNCSLDDISMIGELKGLQILSFRGSDIRKLPIQLRELTALKMLDLSDCTKLSEIEPNVLGSLTKLEELNMENSFKNWEIDEEDDVCPPSNARLVELKNMPRLSNVWLNIPSTSMLPKDDELFLSTLSIYKIILGDDQKHHQDIIDAYRKETKVMMLKFDDSPNVLHRVWVQATLQKTEVLVLNGSLDGQLESIDEVCLKGFECLKHLRVRKCPSIRYIVSSNCGSNYMNLETLYLEDLENLEKLCDGLPGKETFSKLEAIEVLLCKKLTYLFDFCLLKCNSELEKIYVMDCREIHSILVIDEDDMKDDVVVKLKLQRLTLADLPSFSSFCIPQGSKPSINNVLFSGKKVAFPCLESLKISELHELEYIWHPADPPTEVGDLRLLSVISCSKLVGVINSNVFTRLPNSLETLDISECASIKHVFDLRYEVLSRGGRFKLLKEIEIQGCDNMEAIIVVMMTGEETQQVAIEFSSLKKLMLWSCKKLKTFCWYSMYQVEDMSVSDQVPVDNLPLFSQKVADMEIIKFTFPCLRTLQFYQLPNLDRFNSSSATSVDFPFLEDLCIWSCPKVKTLFIERSPAIGLVSAYDEDLNSNGIRTALFGYGDKQAQSIPNLRYLELVDLENFTGIWKMEQSDDERCSADGVTLQHNLGGNVEESEFCIRKLQSLRLENLPKLEGNIFISNQKWTINNHDKKKKKKYILFPSLEKFKVHKCVTVKLFDSDSSTNQVQLVNTCTVIEQFCILSQKEIPSSLRSFKTSCDDGSTVKMTIEEHDMGLEQKHLHLTLSECKSSDSCMSLLPLTSPLFCNIITRITVVSSNSLEYLFTLLGVTRLVHLTYLGIQSCGNIKEIVVAEVEDADNGNGSAGDVREITFKHLKELRLANLDNLESFFSSVKSFNLNFPSLEKLTIHGCPKMRSFSTATLTTPKLKGVQWSWMGVDYRLLSEDLNTTIQKKYAGRHRAD